MGKGEFLVNMQLEGKQLLFIKILSLDPFLKQMRSSDIHILNLL